MLQLLKKIQFTVIGIGILLFACTFACNSDRNSNSENAQTHVSTSDSTMSHFSQVFDTKEEMIFRGVSFNMDKKTVKEQEESQSETVKLVEDVKNMLFYEVELTSDTSKSIDYAEIKYFFDVKEALDIISVNYFIMDSLTISNLSETIFQKMTEKYGDSYVDSEGYIVWESSFTPTDGESTLFEVATKKLMKLNDPGITVEYLKY